MIALRHFALYDAATFKISVTNIWLHEKLQFVGKFVLKISRSYPTGGHGGVLFLFPLNEKMFGERISGILSEMKAKGIFLEPSWSANLYGIFYRSRGSHS